METRVFLKKFVNICRLFFLPVLLFLLVLFPRLAFYFNKSYEFDIFEDSWGYLTAAKNLPQLDVFRTPGYPLLVRIILERNKLIMGIWDEYFIYEKYLLLKNIVILQMILGALAVVIFYFVCLKIFKNKILSFFSAIFVGYNFLVFSFEKAMLPESLTLFLFCLFTWGAVRFLVSKKLGELIFMAIILTLLIFLRPIYMWLPIVIFLFFLSKKFLGKKEFNFRKDWPLCLILLVPYFLVFLYSGAIKTQYGVRLFSSVSEGSLFGKVLQYGIEGGAGSEFNALKADIKYYRERGEESNPWRFVDSVDRYKTDNGRDPDFLYLGKFAREATLKKPVEFVFKSLGQTPFVLLAYEQRVKIIKSGAWKNFLFFLENVYKHVQKLQLLFLFSFVYFFILFLVSPKNLEFQMIFFVNIIAFYQVMMVAFGAYSEYARLRMPADYLIWLSIICLFWVNLRHKFVRG